jgi:sirohydrochlorin cobaltochelatase
MTTNSKPALVLFSHGSTLCGAAQALRAHAQRLQATAEWSRVEVAFLNYSEPRFAEVITRLAKEGVRQIVIVPYFLVAGKFVREDLHRELDAVRAAYPELAFSLAEPVGYHPALADALLALAADARPIRRWREELEEMAAWCERRPDCPLYGRPPCQATTLLSEEPNA